MSETVKEKRTLEYLREHPDDITGLAVHLYGEANDTTKRRVVDYMKQLTAAGKLDDEGRVVARRGPA